MIGEGSCSWDVLKTGKAGHFAYFERDASRPSSETNGNIVPFVSGSRETSREIVRFSSEEDIHSLLEAVLELTLIVAGVAGVIAGVIAI